MKYNIASWETGTIINKHKMRTHCVFATVKCVLFPFFRLLGYKECTLKLIGFSNHDPEVSYPNSLSWTWYDANTGMEFCYESYATESGRRRMGLAWRAEEHRLNTKENVAKDKEAKQIRALIRDAEKE